MNRRAVGKRLLALMTIGLAGCVGNRGGPSKTTTLPTSSMQWLASVEIAPTTEVSPIDFGIDVTQNDLEAPEVAKLRLYAENTGDERVLRSIETGVPAPFGILYAESVNDDGREFLLWSDAYVESEDVFTRDKAVTGRTLQTLLVALEPGQRIGQTYTIRTDVGGLQDGLRADEYRLKTAEGNGLTVDGVERTVTLSLARRT